MSRQLVISLPEGLAEMLRRAVPTRQRSKFIANLLDQALPSDRTSNSDALYEAALAIEQDENLAAEMAEWEHATVQDGFPDSPNSAP